MKTSTQTASTSKAHIAKTLKTAKRKTTAAAKRRTVSARKTANGIPSAFAGYSEQGQRFIDRSKAAINTASAWAGEKVQSLPKSARNINLPDQKALHSLMTDKPLVVGAVGLGLGVVIGALMPSLTSSKPKTTRRK